MAGKTYSQFNGGDAPKPSIVGETLPTNPSGIANVDQGLYQNSGPNISNIPHLNLAFMSNTSGVANPDVTLSLNPISLTWVDFLTLFFRSPGEGFWVSPSNANCKAFSFNNQYYESTEKKNKKFSLHDQLYKAWTKKFAKPEATLSPQVSIQLNRFGFLTKSLASINEYSIGLSLDEVIASLLLDDSIVPGDFEDVATVKFGVSSQITYEQLNISILVNFTYIVQIPGYKNALDIRCANNCSYYSGDKTDNRHGFIHASDFSVNNVYNIDNHDAVKKPKPNITKPNKNSDNTADLHSDGDSLIFSEISKLIKEDEDASCEGSTHW